MRNNKPVTGVEIPLGEETLIVSRTDLKGQITYINKDFLDISGFAEAELLGQPHNIVRHPDMPEAAFADMWRSLQAGEPWVGLVKNRCKNGDHYWVEAHATPLFEQGQAVGYLSVRRKPAREQVEAAEAAYRLFREGRQGKRRIIKGQVRSGGAGWLSQMSVKARLFLLSGIMLVILAVQAGLGAYNLGVMHAGTVSMYQERTVPAVHLGHVRTAMENARAQVMLALQHAPENKYSNQHDHPVGVHLDALGKGIRAAEQHWRQYVQGNDFAQEEHRQMRDSFSAALQTLVEKGLQPALSALSDGRYDDVQVLLLTQINPAMSKAELQALALIDYQESEARRQMQASEQLRADIMAWTAGGVVVALIVGLAFSLMTVGIINRRLREVVRVFRELAAGNYRNRVDISHDDEIGQVEQGLESMQTRLGFDVQEAKRVADENLRVRNALDFVSGNIRIADNDGQVIYANRGLLQTLKAIEAPLARRIPGFSADSFVGGSIGVFYDNPAEALARLRQLETTRKTEMDIGGRTYLVITNPIFNDQGQRLGTVGEWVDRTAELFAQREVAALIAKASTGDLEARLDADALEGFYRELGHSINQLLETSSQAVNEIGALLARVAQGDLSATVVSEYQGSLGRLRNDANATVLQLRELVRRIQESTEAINTAAQEIASGNTDLSSRTEEQASSLEETASSMEELTGTVKQNADNAREANQLADSAQVVAERGGQVVEQVVQTMGAIHHSSSKIADIIGVIDGIAFQTNILALNAAVEAARAGEQGRGFAVVATEVRNLAQRSAGAAKEIKGLISDSVEKVEAGSKLVDQAGRTMEEVVSSIKKVARIMGDIAEASREQSAGIEQVGLAVSQMDEMTQQNAALVEEAAAAAESLEEQARSLAQAVSVFRLSEGRAFLASPVVAEAGHTPEAVGGEAPRLGGRKPAALPASLDDEWEEF